MGRARVHITRVIQACLSCASTQVLPPCVQCLAPRCTHSPTGMPLLSLPSAPLPHHATPCLHASPLSPKTPTFKNCLAHPPTHPNHTHRTHPTQATCPMPVTISSSSSSSSSNPPPSGAGGNSSAAGASSSSSSSHPHHHHQHGGGGDHHHHHAQKQHHKGDGHSSSSRQKREDQRLARRYFQIQDRCVVAAVGACLAGAAPPSLPPIPPTHPTPPHPPNPPNPPPNPPTHRSLTVLRGLFVAGIPLTIINISFACVYAWIYANQYSYTKEDWQRCLVYPNQVSGVGGWWVG